MWKGIALQRLRKPILGPALESQTLTPDTAGCGEASGKLLKGKSVIRGHKSGWRLGRASRFSRHSELVGLLQGTTNPQLAGRDRFVEQDSKPTTASAAPPASPPTKPQNEEFREGDEGTKTRAHTGHPILA
ncbi:hypothetical protein PDE_03531 [Penicillium oxalicum 114-2]|uniref:Uncharacterized protein n=1 Tax=Penicillium oxalicum (strain 114-2 / CGMCC 5302) TaxID=933388 RepID=S7ZD62_PENO1|nr:hypothetical protein PDE_03531 [Penicillium oxalicum 114-2]